MTPASAAPNPIQIPKKSPTLQGISLLKGMRTPLNSNSRGETSMSSDPDRLRSHKFWNQYCTLPEDLRILLQPDWKKNRKVTSLKLYSILLHFGVQGDRKPKDLKATLVAAFENELRPLILDFCIPETVEESMEEDNNDFDPLDATIDMLKALIKKRNPDFRVSPNANRHAILILYKTFVDHDLVLPKSKEYTKSPRLRVGAGLARLTIEDLSFALHCGAPHVFIHHAVMFREDYVSLYLFFLVDDESAREKVIEGYHYSIVRDKVPRRSSQA